MALGEGQQHVRAFWLRGSAIPEAKVVLPVRPVTAIHTAVTPLSEPWFRGKKGEK